MSIKQLYDFQCLEQNLSASELSLAQDRAQVGESAALKQARANLKQVNEDLASIRAEQKDTEYAIADLSAKMAVANESLYSGRLKNPKELQNLQRELMSLQAQRDPLEEKSLTLMERAEQTEELERCRQTEFAAAEVQWQTEQAALSEKIALAEKALGALKVQCVAARSQITSVDIASYDQLRKTHGWAIARMEQGICGYCRLGMSTAALQRVRGGQMVYCSSCGRLLFCE